MVVTSLKRTLNEAAAVPRGELAKSLLSQCPGPGPADTSSQPGNTQDAGDGVRWEVEKSFGGAEAGAEVHISPV